MTGKLPTQHFNLIRQLLAREIASRTRGTFLGWGWLFLQPGLQIGALWFLFNFIFKTRAQGPGAFLPYFLIAMLLWFLVQEALSRSLTILTEYGPIYQRTVFPIFLLPLIPLLLALLFFGPVVLILAGLLSDWKGILGGLLMLLLMFTWVLPLCYLLSILGVFIKESRQIVPFLLTLWMYLSPILYPPQAIPDWLQPWQQWNPMADWIDLGTALILHMELAEGAILRLIGVSGFLWLLCLVLFRRAAPYIREEL